MSTNDEKAEGTRPRRGNGEGSSSVAAVLLLSLVFLMPRTAPAGESFDVQEPPWQTAIGTGLAFETGGITSPDPFLLYFGAEASKSWNWWQGLTLMISGDLYTGLADKPMVPYKLAATGGLALGPDIFRMEVLRARFFTEFGGLKDHSTGTNLRFEASTLPTFSGDVELGQRNEHLVSYFMVPVQLVIGQYNFSRHRQAGRHGIDQDDHDGEDSFYNHNWSPYPAIMAQGQHRFIATSIIHLRSNLSLLKAYNNPEFRMQIGGGVILGILDHTVQFSFQFLNDLWHAPDEIWVNTATFTLSARMRI